MNGVMCPLCGKENPDDVEVCQFCEARLKPLRIAPEPESVAGEKTPPDQNPHSLSGDEIPEWLSTLREADGQEQPRETVEGQSSDWLRGFREQVTTKDFSSEPQPWPEEGLPGSSDTNGESSPWLEQLSSEAAINPDKPDSQPSGVPTSPQDELTGQFTGSQPGAESSDINRRVEASSADSPQEEFSSTPPTPSEFGDTAGSLLLKRILADRQPGDIAPSEKVQEGFSMEEKPAEEFPDWLDELKSAYGEAEPAPNSAETRPGQWSTISPPTPDSQPSKEEELPSWLEEMPGSTIKEHEPANETAGRSDSLAAELPSWLEELRPIENPELPLELPEEFRSHVEIAGPLAGLPGILPAEPEISISRKPSVYAMRIQVSESQQNQAAIFTETIKSEDEYHPPPVPIKVPSQQLLRIVIALVLLLGILAPTFSFYPQVEIPSFMPAEVLAVSQIVSSLPPGSPVLVAVEFEPGYSGEMDAALGAVLDHLMIQGAFLAFVSTSGTGPMQAEHLVGTVNQFGDHGYSRTSEPADYVNLGYISGGSAGLKRFAENPTEAIVNDIDGSSPWNEPAISGFDSISQFSLVIVATENINKARDWIEQVQPDLEENPMVFVTSMQSEPGVWPYYNSSPRQVQGIVSGLTGGVYYGDSIGRIGIAHRYWPSFNSGLLLVLGLIVVFGGVNAIQVMLANINEKNSGRKVS